MTIICPLMESVPVQSGKSGNIDKPTYFRQQYQVFSFDLLYSLKERICRDFTFLYSNEFIEPAASFVATSARKIQKTAR